LWEDKFFFLMKGTHLIKVLLVFEVLLVVSGAIRLTTSKGISRKRVKRGWVYPKVTVPETRPEGTFSPHEIFRVSSDNSAAVHFELEPSAENGNKFTVSDENGEGVITQMEPLDREQQASYVLTILAMDANGNLVENPQPIDVSVTDLNDNAPIFNQQSLIGSVQEDQTSGHVFMRISGTDADSSYDNYNVIRYSKDGEESPPGNRFNVASNGEISVVGQLDAEGEPVITIPVKAQDGYPGMGYTTRAVVTVTVLDANDHAPVFLKNPYRVEVGELYPLNKNLDLEIAATDADKGPNSEVSFRITDGDPTGIFKINSKPSSAGASIGEISLQKELDYETTRRYVLTVQGYNKDATNANDPQFMSDTQVEVTVLDENEPPVFINTPYSGNVDENKQAPIQVGRVTADDLDFGGTQTMTYSIENTDGWFTIDDAGNVATAQALDRENENVDQITNEYILSIRATDNGTPAQSASVNMIITINDVNDNAPQPSGKWEFNICETPNSTLGIIAAVDIDGPQNGAPFTFRNQPMDIFKVERATDRTAYVIVLPDQRFNVEQQKEYIQTIDIVDSPSFGPSKTGQGELRVNICRCGEDGDPTECVQAVATAAGFSVPILIAIIAAILIILIIVLAVVAYNRRGEAVRSKEALLLDDEDDVRENLQAYHDEGGGEEDNDAYDMAALQPLPPGAPARIDEKPSMAAAEPQHRFPRDMPPDTDIGEYINDAKKQADNDPTAPPFDSLLVFDYEGQGSDAGSLSSLNSGTSDGSQDYNYLNNWGPRFQKLADMYGGGEED